MKRSTQLVALLALAAGGLMQAHATTGPIGWWRQENNMNDSAGTNHGFINTGVSYVDSDRTSGKVFRFHGGIVQVPDAASLDPLTNLTVQAWVKGWPPNSYRYIVCKAHGSGGVSYALYSASGGGACFFVNVLNATNNSDITVLSPQVAAGTVWDGNWHQLTGTFDGTNAILYFDGAIVGAGVNPRLDVATNISYVTPGPLVLGDYRPAGGLPFTGLVDDVKVFNVALSDVDVADTISNPSSPAGTRGLVSWYRADGDTQDAWGTNHGTVTIPNAASRLIGYAPGKSGTGLLPRNWNAIVPDSPDLQPANLSLSAWVRSVSPSTYRYIVTKTRGTAGGTYTAPWGLYTAGTGGAVFIITTGDGFGGTLGLALTPSVDSRAVWDGAWHQLTGTWDGLVARIYLDGLEWGATTNTSASSNIEYSQSRDMLFGDTLSYGNTHGENYWYAGYEDEIKLYDRALDPSEVLADYASYSGLVSWWRANTNATDSVAANHGTLLGGATYTLSRNKVTAAFSTVAGAVTIPDAPSLRPTQFTLEAEVAATSPGVNKYIVAKSDSASAASYAFYTGPNGGLVFYVSLDGVNKIASADAGPGVWDGGFHLIDGTFDGTAVRLYVDGKQVGSDTPASGAVHYGAGQNAGAMLFGNFSSALTTSANFAGAVDEVKLYSKALSLAQIGQNMYQNVLIYVQPQSTNVIESQNFALSVTVQGIARYQWLFNGTNLPGATTSALTVNNAQLVQSGQYSVRIESGGITYVADKLTNTLGTNVNAISGYGFKGASGSVVEITNTPALETNDFTFQFWARGTNMTTYRWVASKSRDPSYYSASWGFYSGGSAGAIFFVVLGPAPNFTFCPVDAGTSYWDNKWHQFTCIWRNSQHVEIYVDGVLANSLDTGGGGSIQYDQYFLNGDLLIGDVLNPASSTFNWPGDIDEVKFFAHSLSAEEVMQSYTNANSFAGTNGLVYWYRFENNLVDSKSGNDGLGSPPVATWNSDVAAVTVLPRPALKNGAVTGGNFSATVTGPTGRLTTVYRSLDLSTWTPVYTNLPPFLFSEPAGGGRGACYYRAGSK